MTSDDAVQNTTKIDCACCEIQKGWMEGRETRTSEHPMEDSWTALHSQNDGCVQYCTWWTAQVYSGSNLDRRRRHHHHHCSVLGVREAVGHFRRILQTLSSGAPLATTGATWDDTTADFLQAVKHDARPDPRERKRVRREWKMGMVRRWLVLVLLGGRELKSCGEPGGDVN